MYIYIFFFNISLISQSNNNEELKLGIMKSTIYGKRIKNKRTKNPDHTISIKDVMIKKRINEYNKKIS